MSDLSSPSFIPKQNPVKNTRRAASRQVYVLTLVSYLMIISALIAVVALFAYDRYTKQALANEIETLNKEIADFDADEMEVVIDLNERLSAAEGILDMNVSLRGVLAIIEDATIDTVQFESLTFTREGMDNIKLDAVILTDSFDSVLFQRDMFEGAKKLATVSLEDVTINLATAASEAPGAKNTVSFTALFTVNPGEAMYVPESVAAQATTSVATTTAPIVPGASTTTATTTPL